VTLTIHTQLAEVNTSSSWLPDVLTAVTDLPDAAASLIAALPVGWPPAGTTKTWKAGPAESDGAGTH
jgi:hypothetical protein